MRLLPVPDRDDPNDVSLNPVEESIRRHYDFPIREFRKLRDHSS